MNFLMSLRNASGSLFLCGAVHALLVPIFVILAQFDARMVLGSNVWIKPMKFGISVSIYAFTLAWIVSLFQRAIVQTAGPDPLTRRLRRLGLWISIMMYGEILFVTLQAARGVRSHFNHDSPLDDAIYSIMGLMILANTILVVVFFLPAFQHRFSGRLTPALRLGIQTGVVIFLIGSVFGGIMSGLDRHTIGGADGGAGIPVLNWSTRFGDVRMVHALGLHALQVLPIVGWWVSEKAAPTRTIVAVSAAAYAALFLFSSVLTLAGRPMFF